MTDREIIEWIKFGINKLLEGIRVPTGDFETHNTFNTGAYDMAKLILHNIEMLEATQKRQQECDNSSTPSGQ